MRVMVIVKASKESEQGVMPTEKMLADMGKFNEELANAGIMLAGEGLHPTSKGKRVRFSGAQRTVIDGPFAETKELIAGFWMWQVKSMDEALSWIKRAPFDVKVEPGLTPRLPNRQPRGDTTMRVMVLVKADKDSEAGVMPSEQLLTDMGNFNEELVKAGVMLAGEGLHPTSKAKRVRFSGDKKTVIDGPFTETKELIAGFWIWQVKSMEEAIEWIKRAPFQETEIELRPVFEAEDFGAEFTPELREQEERLRAQMAEKQQ